MANNRDIIVSKTLRKKKNKKNWKANHLFEHA